MSGRTELNVVRPRPFAEFNHRSHEYVAGLGREGLRALSTYVLCLVVLATGAVLVASTWTTTEVFAVQVPAGSAAPFVGVLVALILLGSGLALRLPAWGLALLLAAIVSIAVNAVASWWRFELTITLPGLWIALAIGIGMAGFLLSDQVGKPWVRGFVLIGAVVLVLLLITIGRHERMVVASDAAENAYRQLAEIDSARPVTGVERALLADLAELGGVLRGAVGENVRDASSDETIARLQLSCLPGWTIGALDEWRDEASLDREVAALSAVARCEFGAFDPGSLETEGTEQEAGAVDGSDETGPAPGTVESEAAEQAAIDARVAVNEAIRVQRTESNLIETLDDGADGVLSSMSGPNEFAEFRFSGVTWLILLALALLWYRTLEIRAGSHGLGPVDIIYEDDNAADSTGSAPTHSDSSAQPLEDHMRLAGQAIFKQAVVQNVPEPGAVPGSQALAPVGDLISSTDVPNKLLASGIVDALRTILATRGGYTVLYSAHQETDLAHGRSGRTSAVVFVRIRDTRNGAQKASIRFEAEYVGEAAELAGYWVAGWIISRSRYVPEWAKWSERDANAFYKLQWRQGDDLPLRSHGVVDPAGIDTSVNALVLTQRAYAHEMDLRHRPATFNALEDFARASYHQPRYPVARFRRAVALSSLAQDGVRLEDVFTSAADQPLPSHTRMTHLFRDLLGITDADVHESYRRLHPEETADPDRSDVSPPDGSGAEPTTPGLEDGLAETIQGCGEFPPYMRLAMLNCVDRMYESARIGIRAGVLARVRPSEAPFWRYFRGTVDDWSTLLQVSEAIAELRRLDVVGDVPDGAPSSGDDSEGAERENGANREAEHDDKPYETRARREDSHWQISYNLACYYSLLSKRSGEHQAVQSPHAQTAFRWLQRCLDRPNSGQLVREWAGRDPDLIHLHQYADEWDLWIRRVPRLPVQIRFGDKSSAVKRLQLQLNAVRPRYGKNWPELKLDQTPQTAAKRLQERLKVTRADRNRAEWPLLRPDGEFGDETTRAIECMQYVNNRRVTGTPDLHLLSLLETQSGIR